jgi:hypothetical protein
MDYQARETLRQSLFREDLSLLSNEEIERILSSKIELPRNARLALLQLGGDPHVLVLPAPDAAAGDSLAALFERLGASEAVSGRSSSSPRSRSWRSGQTIRKRTPAAHARALAASQSAAGIA